jgi:hypothetical protein
LTPKDLIRSVIEIFEIQIWLRKKEAKKNIQMTSEGLPNAKVNVLNLVNSCQNIPNFVFQDSLNHSSFDTKKLYWLLYCEF